MTFSSILIDQNILAGHPVIKGTRIPVSLILNLFSHGYTFEKIINEYPELTIKDIKSAVHYAEDRIKREEIYSA